jgi:DNA-binding XRE family transcriptional regulator
MYNHYLRGLIINAGLNQKKLASILGMSNATLTNVISGKNKRDEHKQLIADYFNKPIQSIFRGRK